MLTAVLDRTNRGSADRIRKTFEEVEARLAPHGLRVAWPVAVEVVPLPIMGATKSSNGRHTLYVSAGAADSEMLDGLLAHEMGHMFLTEARHPSHDGAILQQVARAVRFPAAGRPAFRQAFNYMQDIYADDLAFLAGLQDRVYGFFSAWVDGNVSQEPDGTWRRVGLCVSNGFALGNLTRHGTIRPDDPLWDRARAFDRRVGIEAVDGFARFFATLPKETDPDLFLTKVQELAGSMARAAHSRTFNTSRRVSGRPRR